MPYSRLDSEGHASVTVALVATVNLQDKAPWTSAVRRQLREQAEIEEIETEERYLYEDYTTAKRAGQSSALRSLMSFDTT